jgi:hypothetical protein
MMGAVPGSGWTTPNLSHPPEKEKAMKFVLRTCSVVLLAGLALVALNAWAAGEPKKGDGKAADYSRDMSSYKKMANDALKLVKDGKLADAHKKMKPELEKAWDKGTADMKKADAKLWTMIDKQMDVAIDATDAAKGGTAEKATAEIQKFIDMLDKVPAK